MEQQASVDEGYVEPRDWLFVTEAEYVIGCHVQLEDMSVAPAVVIGQKFDSADMIGQSVVVDDME